MYYDVNGNGGAPPPVNIGTLTYTRNDPAIHFDWSNTNPAPGVDNSFFAVIWQGNFSLAPGGYTFTVTKDNGTGIRVYVDGQEFYEGWSPPNPPASPSFMVPLPNPGTHVIRVELWRQYTNTGDSVFHPFDVSWIQGPLPVTIPELPPLPPPTPPNNPTTTVTPGTFSPQVYPNPWRSDKHSGNPITFGQLVVGGTIKIFTMSGHEVKEIPVTGSTMPWDLTNNSGAKVASGIYMYLITDGQGNKGKGKVAVIK